MKYKSRKRDARRKLDETETNLLRIHDLVSELEDQINPLKEQSEKALRYKDLREQLKNKEISLYVYQIEQIHESWSEANGVLATLQEEQLALSTVVSAHDAKLESDRLALRQLEDQIEILQGQLLEYSESFEKSEGYGEVLKERAKNLTQNRDQLQKSLSVSEERYTQRDEELNVLAEKFAEAEKRLKELQTELSAEEAKLLGVTGGISQAQEEALKGQLLEVMNQMAQARNEIHYTEQQKEGVLRRMSRSEEEGTKWRDELERLKGKEKRTGASSRSTQ